MLRKLLSSNPLQGTVITLFIAQIIYVVIYPKHKCSDLSFDFRHPNRTITVTPVNPEGRYSDLLIFTYHQRSSQLSLNNANCQLQISKVDGMERSQLQFLKPYIIKAVIERSRSAHVGYIDWDANFIRRPWNAPVDLIVQSNPLANSTNTGLLLFLNKEKHIKTVDAWIEQEIPNSHDQWTWALMERATNIAIWRTADGEFGENYNWNVRDKRRTTARCKRVIFHLTWFRGLLNVGIGVFMIVKVHDVWSMQTRKHCPRRIYLSVILIIAITLSVFFKEQYHQQQGYAQRYFGERICAIPEIALLPDGGIVSRQDTMTSPNAFLGLVISGIGLDRVSSLMSFWFSLLARLRCFARITVVIELVSVISEVCVSRSHRVESVVWCALVTWREFSGGREVGFGTDGVLRRTGADKGGVEIGGKETGWMGEMG